MGSNRHRLFSLKAVADASPQPLGLSAAMYPSDDIRVAGKASGQLYSSGSSVAAASASVSGMQVADAGSFKDGPEEQPAPRRMYPPPRNFWPKASTPVRAEWNSTFARGHQKSLDAMEQDLQGLETHYSYEDVVAGMARRRDQEYTGDYLRYSLLDDHLPYIVVLKTRKLVETILKYSEKHLVDHVDYDEFITGLKFWDVDADGAWALLKEWYLLFKEAPEYLKIAPSNVQYIFKSLRRKDAQKLPSITELVKTEEAEAATQADREKAEWERVLHEEEAQKAAKQQAAVEWIEQERIAQGMATENQAAFVANPSPIMTSAAAKYHTEGDLTEAARLVTGISQYIRTPTTPPIRSKDAAVVATAAQPYKLAALPTTPYSNATSIAPTAKKPKAPQSLLGKRRRCEDEEPQARPRKLAAVASASGNPMPTAPSSEKKKKTVKAKGGNRDPGKGNTGTTHYKFPVGRLRSARGILGVQDDSNLPPSALGGKEHELRSHCTPPNVDITYCDFDMSAEEILTYFPLHTVWRGVSYRLRSHKWTAQRIAEFIYWTRNLNDDKCYKRTTIQKQWGKKVVQGDQVGILEDWKVRNPQHVISANLRGMDRENGLGSINTAYIDYYLVDLAEGVKRHPEGRGAQSLTRAIRHALEHGHDEKKLSEVAAYVKEHNLAPPPHEAFSRDVQAEDKASKDRHDALQEPARLWYKNKFGHRPE